MELSQEEVFRILTEDGKYTGITQEKYKGLHLGDSLYIESGTPEHTKTTTSVYMDKY